MVVVSRHSNGNPTQLSVIAQWALEQSGHGGIDGHNNMDAAAAECQICQPLRQTLSLGSGTTPLGAGQQAGGRWTILDHFLCGKDNALSLLE